MTIFILFDIEKSLANQKEISSKENGFGHIHN